MQWRHTLSYTPIGNDILLPGMTVSIVQPKDKEEASGKIHSRGQEYVFFVTMNGTAL